MRNADDKVLGSWTQGDLTRGALDEVLCVALLEAHIIFCCSLEVRQSMTTIQILCENGCHDPWVGQTSTNCLQSVDTRLLWIGSLPKTI